MAKNDARRVIKALETLLTRERGYILAGEIERLTHLQPEKERLLTRLKAADEPSPAIERLRQSLERNQQLLDAAARGIRSVRMRLDALMTSQSELRTYTPEGQAQDLTARSSRLERKA